MSRCFEQELWKTRRVLNDRKLRHNQKKSRTLTLTSFSESPRHLLLIIATLTLKNVVPHSVATALANSVFPVPGGPYSSTPLQGLLIP